MSNFTTAMLLYRLLAVLLGLLAFIIYNARYKKNEGSMPTTRMGFSIKYHYFYWFILTPLWIETSLEDYITYNETFNYFPFSLVMTGEFIYVVLLVISFIGYFKFTRYSWHTTIWSIAVSLLSMTVLHILLIPYIDEFTAEMAGEYVGQYLPKILSLVYYIKRKPIFTGDPIFIKNANQLSSLFEDKKKMSRSQSYESDIRFQNNHSNLNTEKRIYCRKCGAELSEGVLFCRKCGTKVITEDQRNN